MKAVHTETLSSQEGSTVPPKTGPGLTENTKTVKLNHSVAETLKL